MRRAANPWDRFYHRHEAPWRGERPVQELLPWLGDGPVLELGCGNGKLLRPLRAAGVEAVGIDVSWHALRRLGTGVLADAAELPFGDSTFAAVLDIHCSGHLRATGRARCARETYRVLRPGGHAVVERLAPDDLRAGQGQAVEGEPGMRGVQDGRETVFLPAETVVQEYLDAGLGLVGGYTERHHPGHGGRQVTRSALRILLAKPA